MSFQPAIKWSGSKRSQSRKIVNYFPDEIDTYYEPFVGGGSVLYSLMTSNKRVNEFICSDANKDLIELWNAIKYNHEKLLVDYATMWEELNKDDDGQRRKEYYTFIRDRFNAERNPSDFVFVNRTCMNGLIRYNKNGSFNTSFHFSRKGIHPNNLKGIFENWSTLLRRNNVTFIVSDYKHIVSNSNDVIYADPPYAGTKGMYFGTINYDEFFKWVKSQKGNVFFSFDGKRGDKDFTYEVPSDLYKEHIYLESGVSSFSRIKNQEKTNVTESLYIC